jgi:23S rRNA (cytosine1962-C5)-methyltransferase
VEPAAGDYELLDAGDGRRLERFGELVLDRPAPAMAGIGRRDPCAWVSADARFEREEPGGRGSWTPRDRVAQPWEVDVDNLRLELRATASGQVGLFPEHRAVVRWSVARLGRAAASSDRPVEILNLFAHTGLATLALAAVGARVVHVDASRPAVALARRNADLSGLADRPIRWLVDDAGAFVAREVRRGRRYDGVLLDPPTYGHGPRGRSWQLETDLEDLLGAIGALLAPAPWFVACTVHATGADAGDVAALVRRGLARPLRTAARELTLEARSGARLAAGLAVLATDDAGDPSS